MIMSLDRRLSGGICSLKTFSPTILVMPISLKCQLDSWVIVNSATSRSLQGKFQIRRLTAYSKLLI